MSEAFHSTPPPLDPRKFQDPEVTADGSRRARVALERLRTLWFNTGTLCNLTCAGCYIESSPTNDRLSYLSLAEVRRFLDELEGARQTEEIGFTGGEPFMNPEILGMLEEALGRGYRVLVLSNAMRPMQRLKAPLLRLRENYGDALCIRVSVDHYGAELHELERGPRSWSPMLAGLVWLAENGFNLAVAGRTCWRESEAQLRAGYARLFRRHGIPIDAGDPGALVLFPEMDARADVPEITEACWGILNVQPAAMMCASSRMVVHRKGEPAAKVVPCTLLPYDGSLELGTRLRDAAGEVSLNHPHCARFCVLGGGSCSAG